MKILCETVVTDRRTQVIISRHLKTTLAVGFHSSARNTTGQENKQLEILRFTPQNKTGVRYKVQDNVDKISTGFLRDGKATIWFREPPVYLMINCDPLQLKAFLNAIKMGVEGKQSSNLRLNIASATAIPQNMQPQEKLMVHKRSQYPTKGFPRTLKTLTVTTIDLHKITFDICSLRNLTSLNLSDNKITKVPRELGRLSLVTFLISGNGLGKDNDWQWLQGKQLQKSLRELDLSENGINYFPPAFLKLEQLVLLKLNNNYIDSIPFGIRRLKNLRFLHICANKLTTLPSDFNDMSLDVLDVWGNEFQSQTEQQQISETKITATPLWLLAARVVSKYRLPYTTTTLPWTLVDRLAELPKCKCNKLCSGTKIYRAASMAALNNVKTLVSGRDFLIHADIVLCGPTCKGRKDMLFL